MEKQIELDILKVYLHTRELAHKIPYQTNGPLLFRTDLANQALMFYLKSIKETLSNLNKYYEMIIYIGRIERNVYPRVLLHSLPSLEKPETKISLLRRPSYYNG